MCQLRKGYKKMKSEIENEKLIEINMNCNLQSPISNVLTLWSPFDPRKVTKSPRSTKKRTKPGLLIKRLRRRSDRKCKQKIDKLKRTAKFKLIFAAMKKMYVETSIINIKKIILVSWKK